MRLGFLIAILAVVGASPASSQIMRKGPISLLPEGRLLLVSGNARSANFIALDESSRRGTDADLWVFRVISPPINLGGARGGGPLLIEQTFAHFKIDCATRRVATLSEDGFDRADKWVIAVPGHDPEPITRGSAQDFMARVMCDEARPPAANLVVGHAAALQAAHRLFGPSGA